MWKTKILTEDWGVCWLLGMAEATSIKAHQHEFLNVSGTRTAIDMLPWMGKALEASDLHKELQSIKKC